MKLMHISKLVASKNLSSDSEGLCFKDMCVIHDATWQKVNALSNSIHDALAGKGLCMQHAGTFAKVHVHALFDTRAEQSYVSSSFLKSTGLCSKIVGRRVPSMATAANGIAVQIEGEVTCELKLSDHVSTVQCPVADLGIEPKVILGQPWSTSSAVGWLFASDCAARANEP
jgi:hypothetical protein